MGIGDIRNYVIGVILFALVITGGLVLVGSFFNADSSIDSGGLQEFNDSMRNLASDVNASTHSIDSSVTDVNASSAGSTGMFNVLIGSTFGSLKVIGGTMGFMSVAASEGAHVFGIPSWIMVLLTSIVLIIIAFGIWAAVMRVID